MIVLNGVPRSGKSSIADSGYLSWHVDGEIPEPVLRWQEAVHTQLIYDVEIDTSTQAVADCCAAARLATGR